jgi:hypothetical protein
VALYVIPDPDIISSGEAQEVPTFGVFPVAVAATSRSADEWRQVIDEQHLPLVVTDIRKLTDAHKGTALELCLVGDGTVAGSAADAASQTVEPAEPANAEPPAGTEGGDE